MSFSIRSGGLLQKRKGSHPFSFDIHGFDEENTSNRSEIRGSRQSIPSDRDSVMNAFNHRDSLLPTLSNRIDRLNDPNFAWID